MKLVYRIAADFVVVVHAGYALFVVAGLLLVLAGIIRRWEWIRNFWFRAVHLLMIGVVVAESWLAFVCPLTTWEKQLRRLAGEETYGGDFIANMARELLFWEFSRPVFTIIYTLFALAVLATFVLAPPRWPGRRSRSHPG